MTDLPTLPKAAYSLDLSDGHPVVAYSVQQMYDFARAALAREQEAPAASAEPIYSLDKDELGIRARTAHAINGVLALGAQFACPPPPGHWLEQFWNMARAEVELRAALAREQEAQPAYPEGEVVGPCVCGSWPGGKCLKCRWIPAVQPAAQEPSDEQKLVNTALGLMDSPKGANLVAEVGNLLRQIDELKAKAADYDRMADLARTRRHALEAAQPAAQEPKP